MAGYPLHSNRGSPLPPMSNGMGSGREKKIHESVQRLAMGKYFWRSGRREGGEGPRQRQAAYPGTWNTGTFIGPEAGPQW